MNTVLGDFEAVTLQDISSVSLLNRVDSKYLMSREQLEEYLALIELDYYVVETGSERVFPYNTVYFDTEDLYYYHSHHKGKLNRMKLRSREYVGTGVVFNEVKKKKNTGKTKKTRIMRDTLNSCFDSVFRTFAESKCGTLDENLLSQLEVKYNRITLVDKNFSERITIDLDLKFRHETARSSFDNLVIVEIKREKGDRNSKAQQALKLLRCKQTGFSKYCMGIATTHEGVKQNNFKEKLRMVNKLCNGRSN